MIQSKLLYISVRSKVFLFASLACLATAETRAAQDASSINVLTNPDFTVGFAGWRPYSFYSMDASWEIRDYPEETWNAQGLAPRQTLHISVPAEGHPASPPLVGLVSEWIYAEEGVASFSFYARATEGTPRIKLAMKDTDISQLVTPTYEWQRFHLSAPLELTAPYERVFFEVFGPGSVEIAHAQFQLGSLSDYEAPQTIRLGLTSDLDAALLYPGEHFNPGFSVAWPKHISSDSIEVSWKLSDHTGKVLCQQTLQPTGLVESRWSFTEEWTAPNKFGLYSWHAELKKNGQILSEGKYHIGVVPKQPDPSPGDYDIFSGAVTPTDIKANLNKARRMGLRLIRIHGWTPFEFFYSHQAHDGPWRIDSALEYAHGLGLSLYAYLTDFNRDDVLRINRQPELQHKIETYLEAFAKHTKGKIHAFQIWNEPEFKVNGEEYAPYHNLLVSALRKGNPDAKIIGFGSVHPQNEFLEGALKAGARPDVEAVAVHCYLNGQPPETALPLELDSLLGPDKIILSKYGMDNVEIWDTESGYLSNSLDIKRSHSRAPDSYYISKEKQAQYSVRQTLLSLALGLKTKSHFLLPSVNYQNWQPWSLFEADSLESARPVAVALAVLSDRLRGSKPIDSLFTADSARVYVYPFRNEESSKDTWVIWTMENEVTVEWPVNKPMRATSMMGRDFEVDSNDAEWSLKVGPAPIILEFGDKKAPAVTDSKTHAFKPFGNADQGIEGRDINFSDKEPPFDADLLLEAEDAAFYRWTPGATRALYASGESILILDQDKQPRPQFGEVQFEIDLDEDHAGVYELWAATAPMFSPQFTNLEVAVNGRAPSFIRGDDQPQAYKVRMPDDQVRTMVWERVGTFPLNKGTNQIIFRPSGEGANQPDRWLQYFDRIALRHRP